MNKTIKIGFFSSSPDSQLVFQALKNQPDFKIKHYSAIKGSPPKADLFLIVHFDQLMPAKWFDSPKHGTLNLHFSLLPKYRGPAPIQWAIIKGEKEVGISLIKVNRQFDQGEIVYQKLIPISSTVTSKELYQQLFKISAKDICQTINQYIKDELKITKQPLKSPTIYARRLTKQDGFIVWKEIKEALEKGRQAQKIHNLIRGLSPWPGVWTTLKNKRMKIIDSHLKGGRLVLEKVQIEGKKPINFKAFKAGYLA